MRDRELLRAWVHRRHHLSSWLDVPVELCPDGYVLCLAMHLWDVVPRRFDGVSVVPCRIFLCEQHHKATVHPRRLLSPEVNSAQSLSCRVPLPDDGRCHPVRLGLLLRPCIDCADDMRAGVVLCDSGHAGGMQLRIVLPSGLHREPGLPRGELLRESVDEGVVQQRVLLPERVDGSNALRRRILLREHVHAGALRERDVLPCRLDGVQRAVRPRVRVLHSGDAGALHAYVLLRGGYDIAGVVPGGLRVPESVDEDPVPERYQLPDRFHRVRAVSRGELLRVWDHRHLHAGHILPAELIRAGALCAGVGVCDHVDAGSVQRGNVLRPWIDGADDLSGHEALRNPIIAGALPGVELLPGWNHGADYLSRWFHVCRWGVGTDHVWGFDLLPPGILGDDRMSSV